MLEITRILKMFKMFSSKSSDGAVTPCHHESPLQIRIHCLFSMDSLQKKAAVPLPGPSFSNLMYFIVLRGIPRTISLSFLPTKGLIVLISQQMTLFISRIIRITLNVSVQRVLLTQRAETFTLWAEMQSVLVFSM